ncbi:MAG: GT4 family glycosyltransferase PelF [Proteobacteria bacterium]|nr:GT4 family glycosyltransferase PelF [Pseudomonadota bacterium]
MTFEPDYDVCLLLEGTYPFVAGGVSTWLHNLMKALPEIRFTGICILPDLDESRKIKYDLPDNFKDMKTISIHDFDLKQRKKANKKKRLQQIDLLNTFHLKMLEKNYSFFSNILPIFRHSDEAGLTPHDMIYGKEAWNLLLDFYKPEENNESFIDYFWTYRITHLPLFKILSTEVPKAKVYHSISTGYAGLLGVIAKHIHQRPFLLTEHGLYTKERKIEIVHTEWIYTHGSEQARIQKDLGAFQKIWINLFESIGRMTYQNANRIFTLYEGNRQIEISQGADPDKTFVIPNGIDIEKFSRLKPKDLKEDKTEKKSFNVAYIGRIVPIKDIKTFIRACKVVSIHLHNVKFYIMGPVDEDPQYYQECLELVQLLGLQEYIEFTGEIDVVDYYPILDLIVLTSISEAQPLVILEANCTGIPIVASDVGACREMLEGRSEADKELGPSGIVTRVSDPVDTAQGIIKILSDEELRQNMSIVGRKRVESFYRDSDLHNKYLNIYKEFMKKSGSEGQEKY